MNRRTRVLAGKTVGAVRMVLEKISGPTPTERKLSAATALIERCTSIAGQRVLITGSTRGIGRALARGFAQRGAQVIVHGRDELCAQKVASELARESQAATMLGLGADLSQTGAGRRLVERAVQALGGLDIVVNNAAVHDPQRKPIWLTSSEELQRALHVNAVAPFEISSAAMKSMFEQGNPGRIVNISTGAANPANVSARGIASYGISKFALEGLSHYLAAEAGRVTVVTLRPGPVDTDMVAPLFSCDERWQMLPPSSMVPLVLHLASAPSREVHGKIYDQTELLSALAQRAAAVTDVRATKWAS